MASQTMASLTGENQTTVFITAPHPYSLSIAHGFEQDVTKKGEEKKVLENQTTIVLRTAPLHGLKQDVTTKEEDQNEVENLKKELDAKYRKAYTLRLFTIEMIFELQKISFRRAMEKAWFINSIIKERCLISCHTAEDETPDHSGGGHLKHHKEIEKVMEFNKKIKLVNSLGLDGVLFGPSNKRKRSSYEAYDQVEQELEEFENLMNCNREMVPPHEDTEKFGTYCKKTCRRAHPFAKLESREEYLQSVINSLRERETERETKATENEILGYMLLQEIANSTLHSTSRELLNSIKLSSAPAAEDGDERDQNIHIQFHEKLYTEHANAQSDFEASLASSYDAFVKMAKSSCNNSNNEVEQIKHMLAIVEELISEGHESLIMDKHYQNVSAVERRYERELFKYGEDLSYYMRLGRCLDPVSKTERSRLEEISRLASVATGKYTHANGPDSLPTITQPLLPTWRNF